MWPNDLDHDLDEPIALAADCHPNDPASPLTDIIVRMRAAEAGPKLERVMRIESILQIWSKRKEWPLPGRTGCAIEGRLLADLTRT